MGCKVTATGIPVGVTRSTSTTNPVHNHRHAIRNSQSQTKNHAAAGDPFRNVHSVQVAFDIVAGDKKSHRRQSKAEQLVFPGECKAVSPDSRMKFSAIVGSLRDAKAGMLFLRSTGGRRLG